jgi:hypothetical protein
MLVEPTEIDTENYDELLPQRVDYSKSFYVHP